MVSDMDSNKQGENVESDFRSSENSESPKDPSKEGNLRLGSNVSPRFTKYLKDAPRHGHTTDAVTHILREAILDGTLEPSTWLREAELARELSVSRTPIREALRHLSMEGLVAISTHQGAVVAPITIDDTLKIYVVRETLEGLAARLAAKHRTDEHLQQLYEVLDEMEQAASEGDAQGVAESNIRFHKVIRESTDNPHLDRFLAQIEHFVRRFGRTTFEVPGRALQAVLEHRRIADAISRRESEVAEELSVEHMRAARELRVRMVLDQL